MITVHICEQCRRKYETPEEALACEDRVPSDWDENNRPAVGDYVLCDNIASTYYHGDRFWAVARPGKPGSLDHFDVYDGWLAKWVVVDSYVGNWHEQRYVLWTACNRHGREQLATTSHNHYPIKYFGRASDEHFAQAKAAYAAHEERIDIV